MKLQSFLFIVCLMSISALTYSQDKGYYSIGNNKEKLKIQGDGKEPNRFFTTQKGYYHIQSNRAKLTRSLRETDVRYTIPAVITKGYYSIGDNSEKLWRK